MIKINGKFKLYTSLPATKEGPTCFHESPMKKQQKDFLKLTLAQQHKLFAGIGGINEAQWTRIPDKDIAGQGDVHHIPNWPATHSL